MDQYEVKGGDTLSKIALEKYGDAGRWPGIYEANKPEMDAAYERARSTLRHIGAKQMGHPSDYLRAGQILRLP